MPMFPSARMACRQRPSPGTRSKTSRRTATAPLACVSRTAELIADGGTVLVELDPPGRGVRQDRVRLRPDSDGAWFTWAWVGVEAIAKLAARSAFRVAWSTRRGHRWFACLEKS